MYVYNSLFKNRSYCVFLFCICRANIVSLKFNLQMVFANVPPKMCLTCRLYLRTPHPHPHPFPLSFPYSFFS